MDYEAASLRQAPVDAGAVEGKEPGSPDPANAVVLASGPASWGMIACVAIGGVCAVGMPLVFSGYQLFLVTMTLIMSLAILGLNLLVGYNGQLSLGHGAIYAMGAYTTAMLIDQTGVSWWATIPVSAVVCFLFGFVFGWPALRLKGHYLALATFALALATPQLLKHNAVSNYTGGVAGITLPKLTPPAGWHMTADQYLYAVTLCITVVLFIAAWNILRGRLGRATIAIREHPIAASAMGINVPYVKAMTFGISALYTGVAGSLGALATAYVAPDSFAIFVSIFMLVGAIVGGVGTIPGAVVGAAFIQFVPNIADGISKSAPSAIFALFLIASIFLMPDGFVGLVRKIARNVRRRLDARSRVQTTK